MIKFSFANDYSWMREKVISYKITVTPPSSESLLSSRRTRATKSLKVVDSDLQKLGPKIAAVQKKQMELERQVATLQQQLQDKQKDLETTTQEQVTLKERKVLRQEQARLLQERLKHGWKDETKTKK